MAADKGMITLVVLLDYSGAYDTVDHSVMLEVLDQRFGVRGYVKMASELLAWSYVFRCR